MSHITKAMVFAAGLGTRMRPLTDARPKPLIEVAGKTLLDRALDWFLAAGIEEVVVNTHYKAQMIAAHVAKRQAPRIQLSHEPVLLETGGGLKKALPLLGNAPFFSANSDAICLDGPTPALTRLAAHWDDAQMDALLLLQPREDAIGFSGPGDFFLTPQGAVRWRGNHPVAPYVFTGIQLIHPRLFNAAPEGAFSLWRLSDPTKLPDGTLPRIHGIVHDGAWLHVGDPQELKQAEQYLAGR